MSSGKGQGVKVDASKDNLLQLGSSTIDDVPDPVPGGVDVVVEYRGEAALHRAGGHDAEDGPAVGVSVPDCQPPAAVPWTRSAGPVTKGRVKKNLKSVEFSTPGLTLP